MLDLLFEKYNQFRKEKYFKNPLFKTKKKYACIGLGMHSLTNIYPILRHFNIHVKYLCTKKSSWNKDFTTLFPGCHFTNDLSVIANDNEIEGVFVCATESEHYLILSTLLKAGKKVFVEKPPCSSLKELLSLIDISQSMVCKVGLQRRYWEGNKFVTRKTSSANSYIYRFYFGAYHGNVVNDLFIHAIDYSNFLFGNFSISSITSQKDKKGVSFQMHVKHGNGIIGMLELSTQYAWNDPIDNISILCADEILTVQYPLQITGLQKPKRILNIPTERIYQSPVVEKKYFSSGNVVMPVAELNTLVLQGFYKELETFIQLVESRNNIKNTNDLTGLVPVYKILDELNTMLYAK